MLNWPGKQRVRSRDISHAKALNGISPALEDHLAPCGRRLRGSDPGWRGGDVVYAEAQCMALPLGIWVDATIAPLPDRLAALIEFTPSRRGAEGGFWGRLVRLKEMAAIWP